jgi:energy-coupling factor transport system permease protein
MRLSDFDPRARVILYVCFTTAVLVMNDLRALVALALLGIALLIFAKVPWAKMKSVWLGAVIFIGLITVLNLFFRTPYEAVQQALRAVAMASMSLAIVLTFDPAYLGITFRSLGIPDKLAFALDLTARFVPMLMRDFRATIDAQKARGYELELRERSLRGYLTVGRRFAPLIVPVVVRAVLDAEDRANAMDLRAFGTGPRTWLQELRYAPRDFLFIAAGIALLAGSIFVRIVIG